MKKKKLEKHTLLWIIRVAGRAKWMVLVLAFIQMIQGICSVTKALLFRELVNEAVARQRTGFLYAVAALVGLIVFQIVLGAFSRFLYDYAEARMENRFKLRLFNALLTGSYSDVTRTHSGEWMNCITSDTSVVAGGVISLVPGLVGTIVRLFGALAAIVWLEPRFLYIVLPGGIAMVVLTFLFRKIMKKMHKQIREADGRLRVFLQERLGSLLIVRTFAQEERTAAQAADFMTAHQSARMKRSIFSTICNSGFSIAMNGMYCLGVFFCGYGILNGTMTYGNLMAIVQLIGQVQSPFANISGFLPRIYAMTASAERLMEAEAFAEDAHESLPESCQQFYSDRFRGLGLRHATFTYQPPVDHDSNALSMPVVLKDLDLEIAKGEYVVFTGPSGCGKSTVLKLLMSLYPLDSGEAYMLAGDGESPLTGAWRRLFAYVPQGNQLLTGSIREIIAFGDKQAMQDETRMQWALKIACADSFVNALDHGLDTMLGERGAGLSEGQMQRIAIARAIFSDHPILLLDEATSALDEATAIRMLANLRAMTDKTVVMVTHRTGNMHIFDKEVAFSKDGAVVIDLTAQ